MYTTEHEAHIHVYMYTAQHEFRPDENMSPEKRGGGRGSGGIPMMSGGSNFTSSSCIDLVGPRGIEGTRGSEGARGRGGKRKHDSFVPVQLTYMYIQCRRLYSFCGKHEEF